MAHREIQYMANENEGKRYLDQDGLSALWDKIKGRDIQLSGAIHDVSAAIDEGNVGVNLESDKVSGVLPISHGGLGTTSFADARGSAYLDVYSKGEVDSLFNGQAVIVTTLPTTGEPGKIYYVGPTGTGSDQYDEYIWDDTNKKFIKVGEHSIDLSGFYNDISITGTGNAITTVTDSNNTIVFGKDGNYADVTATNALSSHVDYVSGAVEDVANDVVELSEVIDELNSRISGDTDSLSGAIDVLNSRVTNNYEELTGAINYMAGSQTYQPWQTITAWSMTSGVLSTTAADIPSITQQDIENLDNRWSD